MCGEAQEEETETGPSWCTENPGGACYFHVFFGMALEGSWGSSCMCFKPALVCKLMHLLRETQRTHTEITQEEGEG